MSETIELLSGLHEALGSGLFYTIVVILLLHALGTSDRSYAGVAGPRKIGTTRRRVEINNDRIVLLDVPFCD